MNTKEIETQGARIRLINSSLVENVIIDYTSIDTEEVLKIKEVNLQLTDGKPYAVLVDSGLFTSITKEARELSASTEFAQRTIAKALLVHSLGHRIVGEFYIKINKPIIKTKIFTNRDKAIEWLNKEILFANNSN